MVGERKPPSTRMSVPVTKLEAPCAARKTAALESSRRTKATHWRVAKDLRSALGWGAVIVVEELFILFGWEKARRDGIHAIAAGCPFAANCDSDNTVGFEAL